MPEVITLPKLNHAEFNVFFENDLKISRELVEPIFDLPRASVVTDLKTIWRHAITNSEAYFSQEWDMKTHEFVRHITWLACDLKATELLPELLDFLRLKRENMDFWIGDSITENFHEVTFWLAQDDLALVKKFVFEQDIEEFHKWSVIKGVAMIAVHIPERRVEIIQWFSSVMDKVLKEPEKYDNNYGWEIVTPIMTGIASFEGIELLEKAKELFELDLVDSSFYGDWVKFKKRVLSNNNIYRSAIFNNIFERYENAVKNWYYYKLVYDEEYIRAEEKRRKKYEEEERKKLHKESRTFQTSMTTFVRKDPKVGRNDPCPCGSGKKYKKCCLNK